jgi:hypothetical protein
MFKKRKQDSWREKVNLASNGSRNKSRNAKFNKHVVDTSVSTGHEKDVECQGLKTKRKIVLFALMDRSITICKDA